ncbi:unnamed protein product [Linum trigynum]|uniref:Uncharacterized protein n=1 Tax=Linum trigynum TaxID=586398 RepID=A0AAV2GMS0_9ROSI
MSRFVLDSNNLWLLALSDRTMRVNNGPYSPAIGSNGQKLEELCLNTFNHQITINREGFMVRWLNPGGGRRVPDARSLYRRLNDVFDWSRYGVQVPIPVETEWDQFELTTGKLITTGGGAGSPQMKKELEEKEKETQRLQEVEIQELKKMDKEKDDQLAAKDKQIANLKNALSSFV